MSPEAQYYINLLSPYIYHYGYFVAFFGMMLENAGIPVPGETALIVISFFAAQGVLDIWLAVPLVIIGDVIGDTLGYCLGRFGGRPLVLKYGRFVRINAAKIDAAEALFREEGGRTVFASQFSSVTRTTGSLAAGLAHMPFRRFLGYDASAATVLVVLVSSVTFYFGKNLDATLSFFHAFRLAALAVLAAIVSTYLVRYYQRSRHEVPRLGLKIIVGAVAGSLAVGLIYYQLSGALILLPRTGPEAGFTQGEIAGSKFKIEEGFVGDIEGNNLLVTAQGEPAIEFAGARQPETVRVTVRNISARQTRVEGSAISQAPVVLDDLALTFGVGLSPDASTSVRLRPAKTTKRFDFAVTGDTRDAGPLFGRLVDSVNGEHPSLLFEAGDFLKDGEKRQYRAFLSGTDALGVPLFTAIGRHEVIDRGEHVYKQLFGPENYSFSYQNSTFIVLASPNRHVTDSDMNWLAHRLAAAKGRNIFVVTYAAPLDQVRFTELVAEARVKTVFSVINTGSYRPEIKGVRYELLRHQPEANYFYWLVRVDGGRVSMSKVEISERGLSVLDRIILAYEELKRELAGYLGR